MRNEFTGASLVEAVSLVLEDHISAFSNTRKLAGAFAITFPIAYPHGLEKPLSELRRLLRRIQLRHILGFRKRRCGLNDYAEFRPLSGFSAPGRRRRTAMRLPGGNCRRVGLLFHLREASGYLQTFHSRVVRRGAERSLRSLAGEIRASSARTGRLAASSALVE